MVKSGSSAAVVVLIVAVVARAVGSVGGRVSWVMMMRKNKPQPRVQVAVGSKGPASARESAGVCMGVSRLFRAFTDNALVVLDIDHDGFHGGRGVGPTSIMASPSHRSTMSVSSSNLAPPGSMPIPKQRRMTSPSLPPPPSPLNLVSTVPSQSATTR